MDIGRPRSRCPAASVASHHHTRGLARRRLGRHGVARSFAKDQLSDQCSLTADANSSIGCANNSPGPPAGMARSCVCRRSNDIPPACFIPLTTSLALMQSQLIRRMWRRLAWTKRMKTKATIPENDRSIAQPARRRRYVPPSSVGFSFCVRGAVSLRITASAAVYSREGDRDARGRFLSQEFRREPLQASVMWTESDHPQI